MSDIDILKQIEKELDINLEKIQELKLGTHSYMMDSDSYITFIGLYNCSITNLDSITPLLKKFVKLKGIDLGHNYFSDISSLRDFNNLEVLYLRKNQIEDITPLSKLTNLLFLGLEHNRIEDIHPLSNLNKIQKLLLNNNQITDISSIKHLYRKKLKHLNISNNPLKIPPIEIVNMGNHEINSFFKKKIPLEIKEKGSDAIIQHVYGSKKEKNKLKNSLPYCLRQFKIINYQGIKHLHIKDLPVNAQWIFLTGENGFGKTSLLQALVIGLFGNTDGDKILDLTENLNGFVEYLYNGKTKFNFPFSKIEKFDKLVTYGPSRLNKEGDDAKRTPTYSLFNTDGVLLNIEDALIEWSNDKKQKQYYKNTRELLLKLLSPYIIDLRIGYETKLQKKVVYLEKNSSGDVWIGFNELASGFKSIIGMVGDMILRLLPKQPDVTRIDDITGIAFIDEFDLHLHPNLQFKLPQLLSEVFPKVQFIASTHSVIPILGTKKKPVCLKVTRDKENGIQIERWDNKIELENLTPDAILSSPIFDYEEIFPCYIKNKHKLRTEDKFKDVIKNMERDKKIGEYDYPDNLF